MAQGQCCPETFLKIRNCLYLTNQKQNKTKKCPLEKNKIINRKYIFLGGIYKTTFFINFYAKAQS